MKDNILLLETFKEMSCYNVESLNPMQYNNNFSWKKR